MHALTEAQLKVLAELCPTVFLDDTQWETLYRTALVIHAHGGMQDHKVVKRFLLDHDCSMQKAGFLSRQLLHLCTVLRMHDEQRNKSARAS